MKGLKEGLKNLLWTIGVRKSSPQQKVGLPVPREKNFKETANTSVQLNITKLT